MKKLLCFALSLVLIMAVIAVPVAAAPADVGYSASRVETVSLTDVPDIMTLATDDALGFSTEGYYASSAFKITNASGMKLFSKITNSAQKSNQYDWFEKTVYLAKDIDMSGVTDFEPIGNAYNTPTGTVLSYPYFHGTFDGQGYSVKNLVMTSDASGSVCLALFGAIAGATVRNLVIDESCSFTYTGLDVQARTAAVIAYAHSSPYDNLLGSDPNGFATSYIIENIENNANVTSTGYAGGILGAMSATTNYTPTIRYCSNNGDISGKLGAGGMIGYMMKRHVTMNNCLNTGDITSTYRAAGLVNNEEIEQIAKKVNLTNCYSSGTITGETVDALIVMGFADSLTQTNCDGSAAVVVQKDAPVYIGYGTEALDYGTEVIGYNPAATAQKKDLSAVLPICTYMEAPEGTTEYKISTPEDLLYFAMVVNAGVDLRECTIYLENDIDMTGKTMNPIGSYGDLTYFKTTWKTDKLYSFAGTFDGQGYTIDNLNIKVTTEESSTEKFVSVGLFGFLRSATIKNLVLGSGCSFVYEGELEAYVGAITGTLYRLDGGANVVSSTIENCYSAATVTAPKSTGGFVGMVESNNNSVEGAIIRNCTNAGTVTSNTYAGGIVGYVNGRKLNILNCRNVGKVVLDATEQTESSGAAGICARPNTSLGVVIDKCINNGVIKGPGTLGGMIAIENYIAVTITNCTNAGTFEHPTNARNVGPMYGLNVSGQNTQLVNNADLTGKTDTTYTAYTITTNFPNYAEIDAAHGKIFSEDSGDQGDQGDQGEQGGQVTEPSVTEPVTTPSTSTPTDTTPTTDASNTEEKKGCGASVGGAMAILLTVGFAGVMLRKKED